MADDSSLMVTGLRPLWLLSRLGQADPRFNAVQHVLPQASVYCISVQVCCGLESGGSGSGSVTVIDPPPAR